ncbi:MarR family transcriptional regulator [Rhodoferax sp. AJA081-3]|uniref:MarR family winged helix-turn-helix transcriptional regulator n=1 Tax=Rhodoferax sp. AJA081-3 TaxID=2752316 RepID=UPI001ADFEC0B|nr:MarR family transcriptional regulator [Rhodoferax sp. AJA081-3]QTN28209.1 MarR family transcriptional regulator [Rhodoferax sp. AJA081-3]
MAAKPKTNFTRKASPLPVSQLESHLGFWLRFVSNHVSGEFKRQVEANGVSVSEWVALRQLYNAGEATAAELMDALGMTKGAVSKIITRLQDKGLVSRAAVDADRRAQQIVLSAAGRKLVPRLARLADDNDEAFFGHMEPALRAQLTSVLQDIVRTHQLKQLPVE